MVRLPNASDPPDMAGQIEESRMSGPLICAVDDSPDACEVARVAGSLAERTAAKLVLVHVAREWERGRLSDDARRRADKLLAQIASASDLVREPDKRVLFSDPAFGDPVDEILAIAADEEARMLVVGSPHHGPLKAALRGSVSRGLIGRSTRPVLIVPHGAAREFRMSGAQRSPSVVCGVDGSPAAELATLHAAQLATDAALPQNTPLPHRGPPDRRCKSGIRESNRQ